MAAAGQRYPAEKTSISRQWKLGCEKLQLAVAHMWQVQLTIELHSFKNTCGAPVGNQVAQESVPAFKHGVGTTNSSQRHQPTACTPIMTSHTASAFVTGTPRVCRFQRPSIHMQLFSTGMLNDKIGKCVHTLEASHQEHLLQDTSTQTWAWARLNESHEFLFL